MRSTGVLKDTQSVLERVDSVDDVEQLQSLLSTIAGEFGFDRFTYIGGRAVTINGVRQLDTHELPVCVTNFPEDWSRTYVENGYYRDDPAIAHLMSSVLPATWDEFARTQTLRPTQRRVLNIAADFGLRRGMTIPIHGPGGEFGLLSLTSDCREEEFARQIAQSRHTLHLVAIHLHSVLQHLVRDSEPQRAVRLTQREVEVLRWTAEGKTSWEISNILKLSERTVNFHIESAKKKLGVFSKTHAVAKMYTLGIAKIF